MRKIINYNLIRSKRKTIAIHITKEAAVEVRAPLDAAKSEINLFITESLEWINERLTRQENKLLKKAAFSINYGDYITFRGKQYIIAEKSGKLAGFDGEQFFVPSGLTAAEIKQAVIQVYKKLAKQLLNERIIYYAKLMGLSPASVKVNSAKTRWGSCSGKNNINFSWRLVMANDNEIDYVVVHELAHIKEHNHSNKFWAQVAAICPNYKEMRNKLKKLQEKLVNENWD